jgi:hypothetical protein
VHNGDDAIVAASADATASVLDADQDLLRYVLRGHTAPVIATAATFIGDCREGEPLLLFA